jgi:hypothetical protein
MKTEAKEKQDLIYGIDGLASFLHCSYTTASKLAQRKVFPRYQIPLSRQIFFKPDEILQAIRMD